MAEKLADESHTLEMLIVYAYLFGSAIYFLLVNTSIPRPVAAYFIGFGTMAMIPVSIVLAAIIRRIGDRL